MTSINNLLKRVDRMITTVEQHQAALVADETGTRLQDYAREGLFRKLALAASIGTSAADFSEQCRAIDQDIQRRMTPAEQRLKHQQRDIYAGAREQLLARLSMYAQNGEAA